MTDESRRAREKDSLAPSGEKPGGGPHVLRDELLRLSLPSTYEDPQKRYAWAASVSYLILLLGVTGMQHPERPAPPPPPPPVFMPVETFVPQSTESLPPEPEPEPLEKPPDPDEPLPEPPTVAAPEPTSVAALTPAVQFSIPVDGPVKVVAVERAEPGPPAVKPAPVVAGPPRPSGPTVFRRSRGGSTDGGSYPEPDYPKEALRLKQQGTATLLVLIDADGAAISSKLHQTSGSEVLDKHTVLFVKKRWKWPPGEPRQYYVPVEYRLQ